MLAFLAIIGPGIITSAADNDAGGITTYSVAGSTYGYSFLWVMVVVTFVLIVVQEMSARMGAVTQKGLGELIREEFGVRWTLFALVVLLVANIATTIAEFAGISASLGIFGISPYISVPISAVVVWLLVVRGSFRTVERVFLFLALIYGTYIISGILARPQWDEVLSGIVRPTFQMDTGFIMLFIAIIGTTITPWMQFFLQATVVDKGVDIKNYKYQKWDVIIGSILTDVVSIFIIIATAATLFPHRPVETAADAAVALRPLAGNYAQVLFAIGLFNASLLAAAVLPLSTAYTYSEAFGLEIGISRRWKEAPAFYGIYTFAIVVGAGTVLIPGFHPIRAMVTAQFVQGILLPVVLVFMLLLINNRRLMGDYANSRIQNLLAGGIAVVLILLTIALLVTMFIPGLG